MGVIVAAKNNLDSVVVSHGGGTALEHATPTLH